MSDKIIDEQNKTELPKSSRRTEKKELTIESAKALIELKNKQRAEDCSSEVEKVLRRFDCRLVGSFVFDPAGPRVDISIATNPQ